MGQKNDVAASQVRLASGNLCEPLAHGPRRRDEGALERVGVPLFARREPLILLSALRAGGGLR